MKKVNWIIRSFEEADFEKASQLRKVIPVTTIGNREALYYRWKVLKNPVKTGIFYVADDKGKIAGFLTLIPKRICIKGKIIVSGELCDAFTNPGYQKQGICYTLVNVINNISIQQGIHYIYTTPNELSLPVEKKAGYKELSDIQICTLVRPINIKKLLEIRLRSIFLAKMIEPIISLVYKYFYKIPHKLNKQSTEYYMSDTIPNDIYTLWKKVAKNYDWILERNKEYVDWRFVQNPESYDMWFARNKNNDTLGYIVTNVGNRKGLKVLYLADFISDETHPDIFRGLMISVLNQFSVREIDMVVTWAVKGSYYYKVLRKYGFQKSSTHPIAFYKDDSGEKIIDHQGKWHFTMADCDNI